MSKFNTKNLIVAELRNAPATVTEVASEISVSADAIASSLRAMHKSGRVARRMFYPPNEQPRWLYMLPEHAAQIKKGTR